MSGTDASRVQFLKLFPALFISNAKLTYRIIFTATKKLGILKALRTQIDPYFMALQIVQVHFEPLFSHMSI